jgi:hypothetical protein
MVLLAGGSARGIGVAVITNITGYGLPLEGADTVGPEVYSVVFSHDGKMLAAGHQGQRARIWNIPQGTMLTNLIGHSNIVVSVDFSPDGQFVATTSPDGTARIWRTTNGSPEKVIVGAGDFIGRFSADGRLLVTAGDEFNGFGRAVSFWSVSDGRLFLSYDDPSVTALAVASNGKWFAYGTMSGTVVLARMPLLILDARVLASQFVLEWQGGTGLYQLQQQTNLVGGAWRDIGGPTTDTIFTTNMNASGVFYRVQSLPSP